MHHSHDITYVLSEAHRLCWSIGTSCRRSLTDPVFYQEPSALEVQTSHPGLRSIAISLMSALSYVIPSAPQLSQ